jgi:hypothetical protein
MSFVQNSGSVASECFLIILMLQNPLPFSANLDFLKRKESQVGISGDCGGYRTTVMLLLDRNSCKDKVLLTGEVLWWRNQSPVCHFSHFHCTLSGRHHRISA